MLSNKERKELLARSQKRMLERGAPFHGITEAEVLQLRDVINELTKTTNNHQQALVELGDRLKKTIDTVGEQKFQSIAILNACRNEKVFSKEQFDEELAKVQFLAFGLEKVDVPLDKGLMGVIYLRMFDGDERVDDQKDKMITYEMGSGVFPFEDQLTGMRSGEKNSFVIEWSKCQALKHLLGKNIQVLVELKHVCRSR